MEAGWQAGVDALKNGDADDAINLLKAHLLKEPDSFEGHNFIGVAYSQQGRPQDALHHLQKAVQLSPGSPQAHYNLGVAYSHNAQTDDAKHELQEALRLNPNHEQAKQSLASLDTTPAPVAATPESQAPTQAWNQQPQALESTLPVVVEKPHAFDYLKSFGAGLLAAIVGAVLWDKVVFYSGWQIGLIAVAVGWGVGYAISWAAGHKTSRGLQVMGALLALFGMYLGQALIVMDYLRTDASLGVTSESPILLLLYSLISVPNVIKEDLLTLAFFAIGVWEGWKLPGETGIAHEETQVQSDQPAA